MRVGYLSRIRFTRVYISLHNYPVVSCPRVCFFQKIGNVPNPSCEVSWMNVAGKLGLFGELTFHHDCL